MQSFYWFDFETFGVDPTRDRPCQFAGIRTDLDFNIIDEPLNIFCRPADDFLPHPEACLVTGITPQKALIEGVCERDFFRRIHLELATANTCAVGFNNIRFDDEVVRFGLYRNFFDAYAREWQAGNSRWDILDLLRMTHALRPEGINWPRDAEGKATFRLEALTKANGIEHGNAHDALADVHATIAMARLVKQKQPRLFDYLYQLRDKRLVMAEIDLINLKPFVHCSGMLGPEHDYCAIMLPLAAHPTNRNCAICLDLTKPMVDFSEMDISEIETRLFTRRELLPPDCERLPVKAVHYNKCPAVAPLGVLDEAAQRRLNIDLKECLAKAAMIKANLAKFRGKILSVYQAKQFEPVSDPDLALYSGGFFKPADQQLMAQIREAGWQSLANSRFQFSDLRLDEMLFRYRARNAPQSLNAEEKIRWNNYRKNCFFGKNTGSPLLYPELLDRLDDLQNLHPEDSDILQSVRDYAETLISSLD